MFLLAKKPQREILGVEVGFLKCLFPKTHKRVIYAFAYINYYKVKHLKREKDSTKGSPSHSQMAFWSRPGSLRACLGGLRSAGQSWLLWPEAAGHLSQLRASTRRVIFSTTLHRLSSFLHSEFTLQFWQVPFHGTRVISAPLPYSA